MLDQNIINQLTDAFKRLEAKISFRVYQSAHPKQKELIAMLEEVANTSANISVFIEETEHTLNPEFEIYRNDQAIGVRFLGIPSGHEFSSLVLATLNSDLKGKLPDQAIINRIKNIGNSESDLIKLRTIVSLSCENCPEVVQTLNLFAILNERIEHQMIDGEFVPDLIQELKVQGVPSVIEKEKLIHSGKSNLIELLEKLEKQFGTLEEKVEQPYSKKNLPDQVFDVVVIGAGPAGASAAIYTARKGLKTAVITDRVGGQVQETKAIENFISIPYTQGPELSQQLYKHMNEYDIELLEHRRVANIEFEKNANNQSTKNKTIELTSGERFSTRSVIIATGAKWRELNIPGENDYLGRGVAYCPHCDGPYFKRKDVAVIGGGNSGVEAAIDLAQIVSNVTVLEFSSELKADQVLIDKLKSLSNVRVITNAESKEVIGDGEKVNGLKYQDRETEEIKTIKLDGIFVQIGLVPNSQFTGNEIEKNRYGELLIDEKCRTNMPGVYGAGDVTNIPYKQIIIAMGEGAKAGLTAFEDLTLL